MGAHFLNQIVRNILISTCNLCFSRILRFSVVTVNVLRLFLTVPRVGLQCVFVVFPDHTCFFFWRGDRNVM